MNLHGKLVIICQILTLGSCIFTERNTDVSSGDDDAATEHLQRVENNNQSDLALSSNTVHLILENIQRSLPSSGSSHRRLSNYVTRKERVDTNCDPVNDVNVDVLNDGHIKKIICNNATDNIEGLSFTLNLTNPSNDRLNDLNDDFVEATSDILRFSEKIRINDRQTIKTFQQISRKDVSTQSSGITRFMSNDFISPSREEDNITDVIAYIRTKRDDSEANTIIVVGPLNADNIADVYEYLHKYLKIILNDMRNVTFVFNDSNMVLSADELCTKTWNEYFDDTEDDGQTYCNSSWDTYSCWPRTPAGSTATIRCPSYLLQINKSQNATKHCYENGTWAARAVYDLCLDNTKGTVVDPGTTDSEAVRIIYNVGFSVSTLTLAIALFIFLYFRSLRCLRNSIHCHLIVTFIIKNIIWIIMWHSLVYMQTSSCAWCCKALTTIYNFTHATNFFWMFVEGLYLHIIIVWTYSADKIKLQYLLLIGWGLPSVNITAWVIVKLLHETTQDVISLYNWFYTVIVDSTATSLAFYPDWTIHGTTQDVCWLPRDDGNSVYDYIYIGPILFVLFEVVSSNKTFTWCHHVYVLLLSAYLTLTIVEANIIFLSTIVWVLITKLRASHSLETRQYRKAVKATIILFPLLGIIYVIFITPPSDHPQVHLIFTYINAVLQSFQGLLVAVFYCFLNGEVKSVLKKKLSRLNDARSLSTKYTRTSYNWTRNSRDFGNTTTLANGSLTEMTRTSGGCEAKDTPECIPLTDTLQSDKQT